jgi:hypothetical protein
LLQDIKKWIFRRPEKAPFGKFFANDLRFNRIRKFEDLKIGKLRLEVVKREGLRVARW